MTKTNILNFIKTVSLAVIMAVGISYTYAAWTTPPSSPPSGNTSAPINTSSVTQYKDGAFGVGGLLKTFAGMDADNQKIVNVPTPINPLDAVNKKYVDDTFGSATSGGGNMQCVAIGAGRCFYLNGRVCNYDPSNARWRCGTPSGWSFVSSNMQCVAIGAGRCFGSNGRVCNYDPSNARWRCGTPPTG